MTPIDPRPYSHWANHKEKRIFLVVDVSEYGIVVIEVKDYGPEQPHYVQHFTSVDWMLITQEKKYLVPYIPRL